MREGKQRLCVDLPEEMHRKMRIQAAVEGRPVSEIVKELVAEYLKRKDAEPEKKE